MSKYYSIGIDRDGSLEGACREVMKGLHGKLQNEHGERSSYEFWRCQWQLATAVLAAIEREQPTVRTSSTRPANRPVSKDTGLQRGG